MRVYDLGDGYRVTVPPAEVMAFRHNSGCDTIPAGITVSAVWHKRPETLIRHTVPTAASPTDTAAVLRWMAAEAKRRLRL